MKREILIFKPRYPMRKQLVMILPAAIFFGMMCFVALSFVRFPVLFWLAALTLGIFTSVIPFFFIREIRFPEEMVVRRHFLPDRFLSYKEFEQINSEFIQAGGQQIRIGELTNLDDLKEMAQRWKSAKTLKESKSPTQRQESPYPQRGYGTYASFWGLIFGIIIMLMDLPWLPFDPRWVMGGTFLVVYFVYIYVLPKYL